MNVSLDALCAALIEELQAEYGPDLLGVLITGSRVHGTPGPTSDLDTHVLVAGWRRRRLNRLFRGLEIEMFVNTAARIPGYFSDGRGVTLHMFAFGRAIYDPQGIVAGLQAQARALWDAGPPPVAPADYWHHRYAPADVLNDLADVGDGDPATANLLINKASDLLIATHYALNRRWPAKTKRLLADLAAWDSPAAALLRATHAPGPLEARRTALRALAEHVLATIGGLAGPEWSMDWEALPPPAPGASPTDEGASQ
jgi:hypothetical protein